ncbi:MAG: glycosyltransferase [Pyrinomonadaceae bacterium]
MKRILHIIPSLESGGAEKQLANLVTNTSEQKFSHHICTFRNSEFFAPEIQKAGYVVQELDIAGKHPWLAGAIRLLPVIRKYKPDLICSWLFDAGIVSRLTWLRHFRIPIINTLHLTQYDRETIDGGNWSPTKVEVLRLVDKLTAKITQPYFAACSEEVKRSYCRHLRIDESRITTIYNGIDPTNLVCDVYESERIRDELGFSRDTFVYLSVGRLAPQKNYALLLRVFSQLLTTIPQARLVIVGVGPIEAELTKLANSLQITSKVHFLGERKDIGACLEMADVFVMPSLFEGMPLALLEAMFKELPCIVSRIEVLKEVIEDNKNGLLIDPNTPNELLEAMIKLYEDPELKARLGQRAKNDAERRFHISKIASQWESYFTNVLDAKNDS